MEGQGQGSTVPKIPVHPLKNPLVLTRMFKLCPKDVLATFRLVSKQWHQLSLQSWRSTVKITIRSRHPRGTVLRDFFWEPSTSTTDASTTLQKFLNYVEEPAHDHSLKPFRKFELMDWGITTLDGEIDRFRLICGPYITVLDISSFCFFPDVSTFRDFLFKWFPILERLTLQNVEFRWSFTAPDQPEKFMEPQHGAHKNLKYLKMAFCNLRRDELPVSWMELFSHYPNLETFNLCYTNADETITQMLSAIKIIRKHDPRKLRIQHLDILSSTDPYRADRRSITPEVSLLIRDVQLPLESLTIDFRVETESKIVQDILEWHVPTLKKLDAHREFDSVPYANFPFGVQMDNLQELKISDRLCDSLAFLKYTPNLKKLWIYDVIKYRSYDIPNQIVGNTDPQIMADMKLEKCTELIFDYVISVKDTRRLMKLLPNIEKLRMPMSCDQFRLACEFWRNLRDLEVLKNWLGDAAITGLSPEVVEEVNDTGELNGEISGNVPVAIHPNITDLIHLRRFEMTNSFVIPAKLKDCSAFYGFLKLPYLQTLRIFIKKMSDHAKHALYAKIENCTVSRFVKINCGTDDDVHSFLSWTSSSSFDGYGSDY